MSDTPTPETYNLAPWPNETGYDATPTLRCKWCNGVGNMKPLPRKYEEGSLEPGFLAPAAMCPRCNGSGLDPDCKKEEIRKGVCLSKSPTTKWYVTEYPEEGEFAVTDGYEIFATIIGGKTIGDECDLASRIAKLPDLERELDKTIEERDWAIKQILTLQSTFKNLQLKMLSEQAEALHRLDVKNDKLFDEAHQIRIERDEARKQNAKLRDIAEWFANHFIDECWHLPHENYEVHDKSVLSCCPVIEKGYQLRAELDQLKEDVK